MKNIITVVAFGNSITLASRQSEEKKWIRLLEAKIKTAYPKLAFHFINSGVGGNTSREGLIRIERDVLTHQPDYVLVEFGGNDGTSEVERHVSFEEYKLNLYSIRERIVGECSADIVLLTFPPIIDEWHCSNKYPFFTKWGGRDKLAEQYRQITKAFAKKFDIILVDIDKALREQIMQNNASEYILPDGVHLTESGNRVIAETLFLCLNKNILTENVITI